MHESSLGDNRQLTPRALRINLSATRHPPTMPFRANVVRLRSAPTHHPALPHQRHSPIDHEVNRATRRRLCN
jgi:hypothetical protein